MKSNFLKAFLKPPLSTLARLTQTGRTISIIVIGVLMLEPTIAASLEEAESAAIELQSRGHSWGYIRCDPKLFEADNDEFGLMVQIAAPAHSLSQLLRIFPKMPLGLSFDVGVGERFDLDLLDGLDIRWLKVQGGIGPKGNATVLRKMKLDAFIWKDTAWTNTTVLAQIPSLTRICVDAGGAVGEAGLGTEWLSGLNKLRYLHLDGAWCLASNVLSGKALISLEICNNPTLRTLSILKGQKLDKLLLQDCPISDLNGVEAMPLRNLIVDNCPITDITPLKGLPLEMFSSNCRIGDLSPLANAPLKCIRFNLSSVTNGLVELRKNPYIQLLETVASPGLDLEWYCNDSPEIFWQEFDRRGMLDHQ